MLLGMRVYTHVWSYCSVNESLSLLLFIFHVGGIFNGYKGKGMHSRWIIIIKKGENGFKQYNIQTRVLNNGVKEKKNKERFNLL